MGSFNLKPNRGFSLMELLVVLAIFAFLSNTLYANYRRYSTRVSLENLTHQIALIVRQAQVYGISVTQASGQFRGYGAYFSVATEDDKKKFLLYNDRNPPNQRYDTGFCDGSGECVESVTIQTGDKVKALCANSSSDHTLCQYPLQTLHINFTRPNPDSIFRGNHADGSSIPIATADTFTNAKIILESPGGAQRAVVVWLTGQVAVESNVGAY